jgi:hypothetical protein
LTPATSSDAGDFFTFTPGIWLLITDESMKAFAEEIAEEIKERLRRQIAAKRSRVNCDGRIACATTTLLLSIVRSIDK